MPAELLSYYYTNPDTKVKLQFQIILQCAPLLKGIKVSNIMTMATSSCGYLTELLAGTGITYRILYCSKGRSLVLFYRKRALMEHLKKEQVHLFLREYGYEDDTLDSNLYRLAARCREFAKIGLSFPHEIGAFLEYPMEDVKDFIRKQGKDFLCNGYWKVYHNPVNAMAIFNAYDRAKTCAVEEFIKGESIFEITRRLL